MSDLECNESYDQMVSRLKPCSIVLKALSAQRVSQLKVVDDPNRINDEKPVASLVVDSTEEDNEYEEIEVDLIEAEIEANVENNSTDDSRVYSCFFCKKQDLKGYNESVVHLQLHIDYFPVQCSLCDEANIDVTAFVKHCRKVHPSLERAKYLHKPNSNCFNWIRDFLATNPKTEFKEQPHRYCPACDWISLSGDPNDMQPTPELKPLQIIRHIHEHINYMPFSCTKCREQSLDFRAHALDTAIQKHIRNEHKELSPPSWRHFNKKYSIPSLDKFITNYLSIFGVKMPKKRIKKKKIPLDPSLSAPSVQIPQSTLVTPPVTNSLVSNQIRLSTPQPINLQLFQRGPGAPLTLASNSLLQLPTKTYSNLTLNTINTIQNGQIGNVVFAPGGSVTYLQMQSPLLMQTSNDKINKPNLWMEATDVGIVYMDPKTYEIDDRQFKYICVFCEQHKEFDSSLEMCVHYGIHLDYYPVVCMLCEKRFQDLSTLSNHYTCDHIEYKNNLFHYLKEDEKIEQWIRDFVDFQKTQFFKSYVSVRFGDYCFVCEKLAPNETSFRLKLSKVNNDVIRDHIHQHLNYFPYKCKICLKGNRNVSFTTFNTNAIQHMYKLHLDSSVAHSELSKLLVKSNEILDLEKFIDNNLFPKRQDPETPLVLNLKRKLEEIEVETKKCLETRLNPNNQTPSLPSAQVLPMLRNERNDEKEKTPIRHLTPHLNTLLVEKPLTITQKLNGIKSFQIPSAPKPKPIEYIPTKKTFIEPFLVCFHCHQKVLNTTELQSHHHNKHPKLTIASYTPTKRDLIM